MLRFFIPKGPSFTILIEFVRDLYKKFDYQEIITPQIMDVALWHKSGHYENYRENMYFTQIDEREFAAVKPMNCPASTFVYASSKRSYRDLPLRLSDFDAFIDMKNLAQSGITRVRSFCQDDAHIFCTPEQIEQEVIALIDMMFSTYEVFEFKELEIFLSTTRKTGWWRRTLGSSRECA